MSSSMPPKLLHTACAYAMATVVLALYGVEVCPFIEGLGYGGGGAVFVGGFALAFALLVERDSIVKSRREKTTPQGVVGFLNEYFTMIVNSVHAQDGVVDKLIGDAAMPVFGLNGSKDAVEKAVRATLAMGEGLAPVNERLAELDLPQVDNGTGLHFGAMVAGNIDSSDRLEYTVIGDAVNTATRQDSLCKALDNPLLLCQDVYDQLPGDLQAHFQSLGTHEVKGQSAAVSLLGVT